MSYVLSVDIGTSVIVAAIARLDDDSPVPRPLTLGLRSDVVPSVIALGDDGLVLVGEAAEEFGEQRPHRVIREFKRRVGDSVPIVFGDLRVPPEDIFAVMARWVVDRARESEGTPPESVWVSHPASWGEYKKTLVLKALATAGLTDVTLLSEPEAAAERFASQKQLDVGSTIAVYDLGGEAFDVSLVRRIDLDTFDVIRTENLERRGGADFDEAVFAHVTAHIGDAFMRLDTSDPQVSAALSHLRRECVEAKEALSFDTEISVPVQLPGIQTNVLLTRLEFERLIEGSVRETIAALNRAIDTAGTDAEEIDTILLVGGSSSIPLVARSLLKELQRPTAVDVDPNTSIALGAAYAGAVALLEIRNAGASAEDDTDDVEIDGGEIDDTEVTPVPQRSLIGAGAVASSASTAFALAGSVLAHKGVRVTAAAAVVGGIVLAGTFWQSSIDLDLTRSEVGSTVGDGGVSRQTSQVADETPSDPAPGSGAPSPTPSPTPTPLLVPVDSIDRPVIG